MLCTHPSSLENRMGTPSRAGSLHPQGTLSPTTSFSRQLLSQDKAAFQPLRDITTAERNRENQAEPSKKTKRTRVLLDARTELTDEELKVVFHNLRFRMDNNQESRLPEKNTYSYSGSRGGNCCRRSWKRKVVGLLKK
jgi:hypothetical protein